jgi:hypothetical protein
MKSRRGRAIWGRAAIIAAVVCTGCSSHYDEAMRDVALSPERRLEARVTSMERSADRALRAISRAADVAQDRGQGSNREEARRARLANDAEAAAFEYSRQVLMVLDVLGDADTSPPPVSDPLRDSMRAAEASFAVAVGEIRSRVGQAADLPEREVAPGPAPGAGALAGSVAQARADVAALSRDARVVERGE